MNPQIPATVTEAVEHLARHWAHVPPAHTYPGLEYFPHLQDGGFEMADVVLLKVRRRETQIEFGGDTIRKFGALVPLDADFVQEYPASGVPNGGLEVFDQITLQFAATLPEGYRDNIEWQAHNLQLGWRRMDTTASAQPISPLRIATS